MFHRNINKDSSDRRKDSNVANRKFKRFVKLCEFSNLKDVFNKSNPDTKLRIEVQAYADAIRKYLGIIE